MVRMGMALMRIVREMMTVRLVMMAMLLVVVMEMMGMERWW